MRDVCAYVPALVRRFEDASGVDVDLGRLPFLCRHQNLWVDVVLTDVSSPVTVAQLVKATARWPGSRLLKS